MSTLNTEQDYLAAKAALLRYSKDYYTTGESEVDDSVYDALLRDIASAEDEHPDWVTDAPVTEVVAAGAEVAGDTPHTVPMLSLGNITTEEAFQSWISNVAARLNGSTPAVVVEPKMDGLSLAVRYSNGEPVQLVTRGDGSSGEDVTYALPHFSNLPGDLSDDFSGEVRGEVIFSREQFDFANNLRREVAAEAEARRAEREGREPRTDLPDAGFSNPRNGVAGALRGAGSRPYSLPMTFVAFDVADRTTLPGEAPLTHLDTLNKLESLGFTTTLSVLDALLGDESAHVASDDVSAVTTRISDILGLRDSFPYEIDGAVIKVNNLADQDTAGLGSSTPRWATAYKYPAEVGTSVLREVQWKVGRTGNVAPRAKFDPVTLMGSSVTFATLNNPDDIRRKGLMLGDPIFVRKAGDVIPEIVGPNAPLRDGTQVAITIPTECPNCGRTLDASMARLKCPANGDCSLSAKLLYATSRDAWDVDWFGPVIADALAESGLVADIGDLFALSVEDIAALPRGEKPKLDGTLPVIGETTAEKIVNNLEAAKALPLAKTVTALGIPLTGRRMSKWLSDAYKTMDALLEATDASLSGLEKVGPVKAATIRRELANMAPVIEKLRGHGVNFGSAEEAEVEAETEETGTALAGKKVLITGALEGHTRDSANALITANGGTSASSVSRSLDYLVTGARPGGSKVSKAEDLNIPILTAEEFLALIA